MGGPGVLGRLRRPPPRSRSRVTDVRGPSLPENRRICAENRTPAEVSPQFHLLYIRTLAKKRICVLSYFTRRGGAQPEGTASPLSLLPHPPYFTGQVDADED